MSDPVAITFRGTHPRTQTEAFTSDGQGGPEISLGVLSAKNVELLDGLVKGIILGP